MTEPTKVQTPIEPGTWEPAEKDAFIDPIPATTKQTDLAAVTTP